MKLSDAISRCNSLGKRFNEHFHKMYTDPDAQSFEHWSSEMNTWYLDARKIVLKTNNKPISETQLMDWFFTEGSSVDELFKDSDECDFYNKFVIQLLANKEFTVLDAFEKTKEIIGGN